MIGLTLTSSRLSEAPVSKKRPSQKPGLDIPPVPQETRYISSDQINKTSHFDSWISDLVGIDYEELALPPENQEQSRFFKIPSKRIALHFTDALYLPNINRSSTTNVSILDDGIYLTIHLAIASPETLKAGMQALQQSQSQFDYDINASSLLTLLIKLQSANHILETYQYEQFFVDEILNGSSWGKAIFSSYLWEIQPPIELLTDWQRGLLTPAQPSPFDRGAAQLFISFFASQKLSHSKPALATFFDTSMQAVSTLIPAQRIAWAEKTLSTWVELLTQEFGSAPINTVDELNIAIEWLVEAAESLSTQGTAKPQAA